MSTTKLIAFLLGLASLAGLLLFAYMAVGGAHSPGLPPGLFKDWPPALVSFTLFALSAPMAMIPGIAGLGLWRLVVRPREATLERQASALPERESAFQVRLGELIRRLLTLGGDASAVTAEIPLWTRDLEEEHRSRLLRFLAECASSTFVGSVGKPIRLEGGKEMKWKPHAVSLGLLAFGGFCLLLTCFMAFTYLAMDGAKLVEEMARSIGIELPPGSTQPTEAFISALGCLPPGVAALLGGLMLRWLLRREEARQRRLAAFERRAQEVAAEGCLHRIESLLPEHGRIARADVICALTELDGNGKGRLIAQLLAKGALSRISLGGADLKGVALPEADLSGAILTGSDLSGAHLAGARLVRTDLSGSRLFDADLRGADASEAVLRNVDLRQARLHRCILRGADLRGSAFAGANLWQANLADAKLAEASITREQLQGVTGISLP